MYAYLPMRYTRARTSLIAHTHCTVYIVSMVCAHTFRFPSKLIAKTTEKSIHMNEK